MYKSAETGQFRTKSIVWTELTERWIERSRQGGGGDPGGGGGGTVDDE